MTNSPLEIRKANIIKHFLSTIEVHITNLNLMNTYTYGANTSSFTSFNMKDHDYKDLKCGFFASLFGKRNANIFNLPASTLSLEIDKTVTKAIEDMLSEQEVYMLIDSTNEFSEYYIHNESRIVISNNEIMVDRIIGKHEKEYEICTSENKRLKYVCKKHFFRSRGYAI